MVKASAATQKPAFHTPIVLQWTKEKLQQLDQEQLANLLQNLDHQRAIGRLKADEALQLEQRIAPLMTGRNGSRLRKRIAEALKAAAQEAKAA